MGLSSAESEFDGCCGAAAELIYIRGLLQFLLHDTKRRLLKLLMDASSAIAIATRSRVGAVRHLAARYLWVQSEVEKGAVAIEKVAGPPNPSHVGTKQVDVKTLEFCQDFMGLRPLRPARTWRRSRRRRSTASLEACRPCLANVATTS